ncbi:MAG: GHMP kinase [Chloroflexi bacterium]|nr:GHMP kinase [Chloroflexota bacterium]
MTASSTTDADQIRSAYNSIRNSLPGSAQAHFETGKPVAIGTAPGRLDVMGGIADYSGATVLEATIGARTTVLVQPREDGLIRVVTVGPEAGSLDGATFELSSAVFWRHDAGTTGGTLVAPDHLRNAIGTENRWASYVVGVWYILLSEGIATTLPGANVIVHGTVPLGAGVASSAALEVATMRAVTTAFGINLDGFRIAALCQLVEHRVAGAPCGIMDQVTCTLGQAGCLLTLQCQPHDILGHVPLPAGATVLGLDSGVKHAVGGERYPRVRTAAFMGREMLIKGIDGVHIEVPGDHLCNIDPAAFRAVRNQLPVTLTGGDFLDQYGSHRDPATHIDRATKYRIRGATEHAVSEQSRAVRFRDALGNAISTTKASTREAALIRAGRQMYGSHRSYSRNCGLGAPETDMIVNLARNEGPGNGLYGAKITGGGSGGTVAILAEANHGGILSPRANQSVSRVRDAFAQSTGRPARIIDGTSPGAMQLPAIIETW